MDIYPEKFKKSQIKQLTHTHTQWTYVQSDRHRKQIYNYQRGKGVGGKLEVLDQLIQNTIHKIDKQQGHTL